MLKSCDVFLRPIRIPIVTIVFLISVVGAGAVPAVADGTAVNPSPSNIVQAINQTNNQFVFEGNIQVNAIPGPTATPVNEAYAFSSCTDCQTIAVALQVDLISRTATTIAPQNAAIALNYQCTYCQTDARADQIVLQVNDPTEVAQQLTQRLAGLSAKLHALTTDSLIPYAEAEGAVTMIISMFNQTVASVTGSQDGNSLDGRETGFNGMHAMNSRQAGPMTPAVI